MEEILIQFFWQVLHPRLHSPPPPPKRNVVEKPSEHLDTFLGPILSPTWGKGGKRGRMQPQYTFHDTRLAVEAFSTTLDLGVREGEEAKHATKLVTTQGCKKTVVGETSTNGLGHKSVSEFLPSTAQEVGDFYFCGWAICVTFAHTM